MEQGLGGGGGDGGHKYLTWIIGSVSGTMIISKIGKYISKEYNRNTTGRCRM